MAGINTEYPPGGRSITALLGRWADWRGIGALLAEATISDVAPSHTYLRSAVWKQQAPAHLEVPEVGALDILNNGISKICYKLTTPDGQLAVLFGDYSAPEGLQIPPHTRLTTISQRLFTYSDLRTYLCVPVTVPYDGRDTEPPSGVFLQEFGGTVSLRAPFDVTPAVMSDRALQRIAEYATEQGVPIDIRRASVETKSSAHYLFKDPSQDPALIDIPVGRRDL